jgi:peptidoglycan glycosyltransferase
MVPGLMLHRRVVAAFAVACALCLGVGALALVTPHRDLDWRAPVGPRAPELEAGRLVQALPDGARAELSLDARLQATAERLLADADPARGAAVLLDVADGRVLALVGRMRETANNQPRLALEAWAPAASVFKLVTAAALLDKGVSPDERVCFHGGLHSVERDNLTPQRRRDRTCRTLGFALARSQNAIVARLANDRLDAPSLERTARALGFAVAPADELPPFAHHGSAGLTSATVGAASLVSVPTEPLAFARVAAGFWQTTLSPLHGAELAATIARGGVALPARVVERVVSSDGQVQAPPSPPAERALPEPVARALAAMMTGTTEFGSARAAFHDKHSHKRLLHMTVAGKTGSLYEDEPFAAYSWFVGFAPAERPEVAFAVLLGHDQENRVKAAEVARALLAAWAERSPPPSLLAHR